MKIIDWLMNYGEFIVGVLFALALTAMVLMLWTILILFIKQVLL